MLVKACLADDIYKEFAEIYAKLLADGVKSSDILVICPTPVQKNDFVEKIKEKNTTGVFEKINVHTFFGLCYNTVKENFSLLQENLLTEDLHLQPNLCGLEVSGFIFKECLKSVQNNI